MSAPSRRGNGDANKSDLLSHNQKMYSIRLGASLSVLVFAPALYASTGEPKMYGQSHRDVLRMGLVAWEKIYENKGKGMEEQLEASSFYLAATRNLNQQILSKRSKREREQWFKLGSALHDLGDEMYGAVQIAVGGGSTFGWGISSNRTHIAIEELIYKMVTPKEYHENPVRYVGSAASLEDWVKMIKNEAGDTSESKEILERTQNKLKIALVLAGKIGPKQRTEVQGIVSKISGFWISRF